MLLTKQKCVVGRRRAGTARFRHRKPSSLPLTCLPVCPDHSPDPGKCVSCEQGNAKVVQRHAVRGHGNRKWKIQV